jgi:aspartate aminotransferase
MSVKFLVESYVDSISMPENLKVGLMVSEARKKCRGTTCSFDYHGFAFGQSPFHVPPVLVEALRENAVKGHYSAAEGIAELREAVAGFNKRHFGLDVDPARIVIGPGTKSLLHDIFYIMQGDVIIPSPSWIGYFPQVKLMGKHFHTFHLKPEKGYKIQPEDLDTYVAKLHKEQHMLVLNNPHNPTGARYTADELGAIAEVCRKHNVLVVADEIYALTTYDIGTFTSMGTLYPEGTFVTNGLSKDRSSGGYRLGYCILPESCPETIPAAFQKVAATVFTNVSTPTQYAAVVAFEPSGEIDEYIRTTREIHRMMGTFLSREFSAIEGLRVTMPEGSFYFFVDFNGIRDSLRDKGVMNSNELSTSLLGHPYHFAAVTGDACLLDPDDYGARIAFVDYDGRQVFEDYRRMAPKGREEEEEFVRRNAPGMVRGVETLRTFVSDMTGH